MIGLSQLEIKSPLDNSNINFMSSENFIKPSRYSEFEELSLSNIHLHTLLEHKKQLSIVGAVISQPAKSTEDRSEFYEPEDITSIIKKMYQQNGIVGKPGWIMLFPSKLAKSVTDLAIMTEKLQVAYVLNRDKALKLSADFIDEVDAQHWELRDLFDALDIPRFKGSIDKNGRVVLPDQINSDSANAGVGIKAVDVGVSSGSVTIVNTANECAKKANAQRQNLDRLRSPRSDERTKFIQEFRYYSVELFNAKSVSQGKRRLEETDLNTIFENALTRGMNAANTNLLESYQKQ